MALDTAAMRAKPQGSMDDWVEIAYDDVPPRMWGAAKRSMLAHVQRREDLNDLLVEMIGELQVGHNRIGGGDVHQEAPVSVGLLGADFEIDQGHYRIKKVYAGDRWNPFLKAPLAVPGASFVKNSMRNTAPGVLVSLISPPSSTASD